MGNKATKSKKQSKRNLNVIVLEGLFGSGKTSLLFKLKAEPFDPDQIYYGSKMVTLDLDGIVVTYWDLYGRDVCRPVVIFDSFTRGFIYVIDSTDTERLDEALDEVVKNILLEENIPSTLIMVLANKQDIPGAKTGLEIEEALKQKYTFPESPTSGHTVLVRPCSVKTMEGMNAAFAEFAEQLQLRQAGNPTFGLLPLAERKHDVEVKDVISPIKHPIESKESVGQGKLKSFLRNPFCLFKVQKN